MSRTQGFRPALALPIGALLLAGLVAPPSQAAAPPRTKVSAKASASAVAADTPVVVTGKVTGPRKRKVLLERKVLGGWKLEGRGRTDRKHSYTLTVPTWWYADHTLRVRAPRVGRYPQDVSRRFKVSVGPSYTPVGDPADFHPFTAKTRWNSCKPITWKFRQGLGFAGSLEVFSRVLAEVTRATGLRFKYAGPTDVVALRDKVKGVADLVVSWATDQEVPQFAGTYDGLSHYELATWRRPTGGYEIYSGEIALDSAAQHEPSYLPSQPGKIAWGTVMLHEVGHVVGLNHSFGADQVMFASSARPPVWGSGDLAGLRVQGASVGCWDRGMR